MATIQGVYVALFGRPADPTGLAYFNSVTKNGADLSGIGDLASTQEYKDRFAGQNNTQIVNSIYQSLFGRDAEATGLNFFVDALNKGTLNVKNIAIAILDGAQGNDKTISANKVAAADLYTKALDTPTEIGSYTGNSAAAQGRAFLAGVTTTVPTAASVDTSVAAMVSAGNAGNTITAGGAIVDLNTTAGINDTTTSTVKTTTDKNDTINAGVNYDPTTSKIDGGFGTDTLNVTTKRSDWWVLGVVVADGLKSVENVFINNITAVSTIDVTNAKGVQQVWDNASGKALTVVRCVALGTTVGLKGSIAEVSTFNFAAATGTTDSATVAVDNATAAGATIANIETLTLSNTGTSNVGTITAANATVVNLAGAGSLTVALADGAATTVNNTSTGTVVAICLLLRSSLPTTVPQLLTTSRSTTAGLTATLRFLAALAQTACASQVALLRTRPSPLRVAKARTCSTSEQPVGNVLTNVKSAATVADLNKSWLRSLTSQGCRLDHVRARCLTRRPTSLLVRMVSFGCNDLLAAATKAVDFVGAGKATVFAYGGDTYIVNDTDGSGTFMTTTSC